MKQTTAIAVSGGIDSLVAAYLLKEAGHHIIGIHFLTGYETAETPGHHPTGAEASRVETIPAAECDSGTCAVSRIAEQIGMPLNVIDVSREFNQKVVDYFVRIYQEGKTPNPCLVCNPLIKFGTVLEFARNMGATRFATGHYAQIKRDLNGRYRLYRGRDPQKDQSYFLAFLTQDQLAASCFPLGNLTKTAVEKLAKEKDLKPVLKTESQDICFIRSKSYADFLNLQKGFRAKPGPIEDVHGHIIGEHRGLHQFTTGQRRGINCPASEPYYVVRMDAKENRLVVGFKKNLYASACSVGRINWIHDTPNTRIRVDTRVRYRSRAVASTLNPTGNDTAVVSFETPQHAITPGQGAVFYQNDEVLGGGFIERDQAATTT